MANLRTDAILMEILEERKTITGFLDAVFGFLRRNTDFYHIRGNDEDIGFPKGMREQIIFGAMQRYDPGCTVNKLATEDNDEYVPPAIEEIEIETAKNLDNKELEQKESVNEQHSKNDTTDPSQENFGFITTDYKNGNCFENYCWSQTLKDIEIQIKLPDKLRCSRSLSLSIQATKIIVHSKSQPTDILQEGELSHKCKHNDAVWTISEGKLLISLDKIKEIWWDKLFINEPSIDVKKIDCERYIDELPEESQAAIEKLRFDQLQQDRNSSIPSTKNECETLERLRKAWDAEGSPFRGQPFDASMVKFK